MEHGTLCLVEHSPTGNVEGTFRTFPRCTQRQTFWREIGEWILEGLQKYLH